MSLKSHFPSRTSDLWNNANTFSRGGTFSKSLVFQAISNVVVIGHDIFALLLCQFFNLGPHPAKLLFWFPHCEVKNQNWRRPKCDLSKPIRRTIEIQRKKELGQSELQVKRKRPINHPKIPLSQNMVILDGFWTFSLCW